jgi:hypothetical protein
MNTWEFAVWAATEVGCKQIIVQPLFRNQAPEQVAETIFGQFDISKSNAGFLFFESDTHALRPKGSWVERDRIVVETADLLIPISIRKDGNMSRLIEESRKNGKKVLDDFRLEYKSGEKRKLAKFDEGDIEKRFPSESWDFLTHWTNTLNGPWPGERLADYYRAVAGSMDDYPRSAMNTLSRILREKKIRGSAKHSFSDVGSVSFTELAPSESVGLMKWRPKWVKNVFEPYGIAVKRETAISADTRKVEYWDSKSLSKLSKEERLYLHAEGENGAWAQEKEWRFIGDFDFSEFAPQDVTAIVRKKRECDAIGESDYRVEYLED